MRRDVAVMLVVHLLPLQSLALLAHTGQSSLATGSRAAAYTRMKNPLPFGTGFEARRKRSPAADDADYRSSEAADTVRRPRDPPMFEHLPKPNIAEESGGRRGSRRYPDDGDWGPASEMTWIRRRRLEGARPGGWTTDDAGMDWIKRGDDDRDHRWTDRRRWDRARLSWMKRGVATKTTTEAQAHHF